MLNTQYGMHLMIYNFSSAVFYKVEPSQVCSARKSRCLVRLSLDLTAVDCFSYSIQQQRI